MILTKVRFKNFFATGNDFIEIDLLAFQRAIVSGPNGVGKSTILNAITFALFGKTIKQVNKPQIVNSINNKNCLVEAEGVMPNGTTFKVVRGIKPNVFEVWVNGVMADQKLVGDYQDYLEQEVIRCSFRTFTQTCILSVENYKPFMSLTAAERRAFIEDILDIKVFSIMDSLTKAEVKKNKELLKSISSELSSYKEQIVLLKSSIEKIDAMKQNNTAALVEELNQEEARLEAARTAFDAMAEQSDSNSSELKELRAKRATYDSLRQSGLVLKSKMTDATTKLSFFTDNDMCPTCKQPIDEKNVGDIKNQHQCEYDAFKADAVKIAHQMKEFADLVELEETYNTRMREYNSTVTRLNSEIDSATRNIRSINAKIKAAETSVDTTDDKQKLKDLAKLALELSEKQSSINVEQDYNACMLELFKDSGIKSKIVDEYIPVINTLMNEYLEKLDLFVSFNLDSEFNETIKSRHRDLFTYNSFSMGQRQRIDLAIMFTMRELAGMKNSFTCNILGCDEVLDAAVDVEGVELIREILMGDKFKETNLFVVSHRSTDAFKDICDGIYNLYMRDGFTQISSV